MATSKRFISFISRIFSYYVQSNIHVSISAGALVLITGLYFNVDMTYSAFFISLSTCFSYNMIRYLKSKNELLKPEIQKWFDENLKGLLVLNGVVLLLLIDCVLKMRLEELFFILPFALCTLFYMLPTVRVFRKKVFLRNVPGLKIFLIAVAWAGLTTLYPFYHNSLPIGLNEWLVFVSRFLFVIVLTIPFDIRDLDFDSQDIKTIPKILGIRNTKLVSIILLICSLLLSSLFLSIWGLLIEIIVCLILLVLVLKSTANQSKYYASFWVEGVPIIWWGILVVFESF